MSELKLLLKSRISDKVVPGWSHLTCFGPWTSSKPAAELCPAAAAKLFLAFTKLSLSAKCSAMLSWHHFSSALAAASAWAATLLKDLWCWVCLISCGVPGNPRSNCGKTSNKFCGRVATFFAKIFGNKALHQRPWTLASPKCHFATTACSHAAVWPCHAKLLQLSRSSVRPAFLSAVCLAALQQGNPWSSFDQSHLGDRLAHFRIHQRAGIWHPLPWTPHFQS